MSDVETIAREIDRLVWAVGDKVRPQHETLPASAALAAPTFGALMNLIPFRDQLSVSLVRRRFIYRPERTMEAFLADVETGGYFERDGDQLIPTDLLAPIADEIGHAIDVVCREFWQPHEGSMLTASDMAREVLLAGEDSDGLVNVAQQAPEAKDPYHRFWQRLSGLRLIRNEAHVAAWRAFGLSPGDVEVLTSEWAGTDLQSPAVYSDNLIEHGYSKNEAVTAAGLGVRQQIEDATDEGVSSAFSVIDAPAFLELLVALPPWD